MIVYRYRDGTWFNTLLLAYIAAIVLLGTAASVKAGSALSSSIISVAGLSLAACLLLSHAFVLAAYFAHECMHNSIFKQTKINDRIGSFICFSLGAGYYPYRRLKEKHFRHHVERQDVLSIKLSEHFDRHPKIKRFIWQTEKRHIPSAEIYSHLLAIAAPFFIEKLRKFRSRVIIVLFIYLFTIFLMSQVSIALPVTVLVSLVVCYCVLGFMDMYQHDYGVELSLDAEKQKPLQSRDYEETHTYSNLLSSRWPLLNILVLNFCYHNVHHQKSGEPWHRLPTLHQKIYKNQCEQEVSLKEQLYRFHKHRMRRIDNNIDEHSNEPRYSGREIGASGVSFLVGV